MTRFASTIRAAGIAAVLGLLGATFLAPASGSPRATEPRALEPRASEPSRLWSLQRIRRPPLPAVRNAPWCRNEIDRFILAKLEKEGVAPSPEASRPTLIRRLSFDLTGLPPTPAEVDAFVSDRRPDAYDRLVDRLLASPHFGERWARHWLDLARYADSDGYEKDNVRPWAWRWRNWVIDAINRDMPFDQFTIEQLAGDLLQNATLDQKIATGFHRNTLTNTEGGVDQEEFRIKADVDRVNTTGTIWLGLTVGCAQCHNHKYDPLSTQEYYQLFAFFNSVNEVNIPAPLPDEQTAYEKVKTAFDAERANVKARVDTELARLTKEVLPARERAWESEAARTAVRWSVLKPVDARSSNGATLAVQPDQSVLATGKSPETDTYTVTFPVEGSGIAAVRLEALADRRLPNRGPGRVAHGNFVLNDLSISLASPGGSPERPIPLTGATADHSQPQFDVAGAADSDPTSGWAIGGGEGRNHVAVFRAMQPFDAPKGSTLTVTLLQRHGTQHTLGKFRLSVTASSDAVASLTPDALVDSLLTPDVNRTLAQRDQILAAYREMDPDVKMLNAELAKVDAKGPKPPATLAQTLVQGDRLRPTHVMVRGDFQRLGDEVHSRTPACLPILHTTNSEPTRLDLAKWLVDPENPLTPRVTVNRIWMHLFGRGIVGTVDDFGTRGDRPTHPELLDWLAVTFVKGRATRDTGGTGAIQNPNSKIQNRPWSVKDLIRLIVTSAAYRQSSHYRPEMASRDANNLWLARQNRFRMEAEGVRDAYLTVSGLLNRTIGGPSVRPPLPPGIAELGYAGSVRWHESEGADKYRRGLYIFFQRTVPYPMLTTFDAPDMNVCAAKRETSNTPLQALTLLNDPVFVECAQALGGRVVREGGADPASRVNFAFKTCLGRAPSKQEALEALAAYRKFREYAKGDFEAAQELAGETAGSERETIERAAWTAAARIILNLDEFVTRE